MSSEDDRDMNASPIGAVEIAERKRRNELARKLNRDRPMHDGVMSSTKLAKAIKNRGPMGAIGMTGTPASAGAAGVTIANPPDPAAMSVVSGGSSVVIEIDDITIIEAWEDTLAMPETGAIGKLGFAGGIAYIMTREGWVNLGEALSHPEPITDRRGAIKAQKARNG